MHRRCGHFLAALIAAAGAGAHAQVVPVYENDFESPNVTSCDASSFQSSGFTTSYNGTGVPASEHGRPPLRGTAGRRRTLL